MIIIQAVCILDINTACDRIVFIYKRCQEIVFWSNFVLSVAISVPQRGWSCCCYDGQAKRCPVVSLTLSSLRWMSKKVYQTFLFSYYFLIVFRLIIHYSKRNLGNFHDWFPNLNGVKWLHLNLQVLCSIVLMDFCEKSVNMLLCICENCRCSCKYYDIVPSLPNIIYQHSNNAWKIYKYPVVSFQYYWHEDNLSSVSVDCPTRMKMLDNEHPTVFITLVCSVLATDPLSCILWYFKIRLVKT